MAIQWAEKAEKLRRSFKGTSFDDLDESIETSFEKLKSTVENDVNLWMCGDRILRDPLERKLVQLQCKTLIMFMTDAIFAHLALIKTIPLTEGELLTLRGWLADISEDCEAYSSMLPPNESGSLKRLVTTIGDLQQKLAQTPPKQSVISVAAKVANIAWRILAWLPSMACYLVPIIFSAIGGYKAEGVKGAVIATGIAATTSTLTACSEIISEKVVKELARFHHVPKCFYSPMRAITGFAIRIQLMLLTMQANGFLSGMVSETYTGVQEPVGAVTAGFRLAKAATIDIPVKATIFTAKELSLVRSVLLPDRSRGTLSAIADVYHSQIEAIVASYRLGEATAQVPILTTRLVKSIIE
jgi:hypothetical protein